MEIASATLTAALVGVIVVLTRVIEWFMRRSANDVAANGKSKQYKEYNGLGEVLARIDTRLDGIAGGIAEMRQGQERIMERQVGTEGGQERIVERIGDVVSGLDRLVDGFNDLRNKIR
jgi:hypothetical protein